MRWTLLDHIDSLEVGASATGRKTFDPELPLFQDHFPGFPVVPGVLIMESLAQLSGKLIGFTVKQERGDWPFPILTMMDRVKFRRFCRPGEEIVLESRVSMLREESASVKVKARLNGKVHAQAEQIFAFSAVPLDKQEDQASLENIEWGELKRLWPACPPDLSASSGAR